MSVYKKIASNDVKVTPFQVHKNWQINAGNYSASYGVQMLEGNYHSYSFADTRRGKDIKFEATNSNGLYKSIVWDSQNHLYYERPNNPSENFGTNVPEDEERFIYEKIRTISIPSFIYDEQVKKSSFRLTDHYMTTLNWDSTGSRLLGHWKFETSSIDADGGNTNMLLTSSKEYIGNTPYASTFTSSNSVNNYNFFNGPLNDTPSSRVGSGSMNSTNNCGTILIPSQSFFTASALGGGPDLFTLTGSQEYTITMWLKPGAAPGYESHSTSVVHNDLNGTHSGSVIISRDRHKYFELRQLTGSFDAPNGRVGLQMYWGASSSNATSTNNITAIDEGLYLTSGSWNLVTLTQKFMPHIGTSGSMENDDLLTVGKYKQLPAWGYSGETRLRIYHMDPTDPRGFSVYESSSFMQAGGSGASVGSGSGTGEEIAFTNVTSSNQYHRHIVLGCSASAITDDKFTHTIEPKEGNWSGSYDDIRFFGSTLSRERTDNLWHYADMNMDNVPPMTSSIDVYDDGKGNLRDRNIPTGSFVSKSNLIGYWGFNEKFRQKGRRLGSRGSLKNNQANFGTKIFTSSINTGTDKYVYEKTGITQNVSFVDGIRITEQSGSNWNTKAINYYYTDVPSGFAARFNNSYRNRMGRGNYIPRFAKGTFTSSIRIDHYEEINFRKKDEFAISCWIKIPEQQEDHPNVMYYGHRHVTSSGGHYPSPQGNADGTHTKSGNAPGDCGCHDVSGSGSGTDWCDIIIKAGMGKLGFENSVTRELFTEDTQQDMLNKFPFHIRLRNNNHESCELQINTISAGRSDGVNDVYVESKIPLTPTKWHHIVFQKKGLYLQLWQDGYLMSEVKDYTKYQIHNNSDLFFGARGDRKNPWSGSLDEVRFYDTCLIQEQMDSLRDNSWRASQAYHNDAVGNMFYGHGIASLSNNYPRYFSGSLHEGGAKVNNDESGLFSENFRIRFEGTTTLYEQKIKCVVKASDYNLTMNPSIRLDGRMDTAEVDPLAKNPAFRPYVTTVGLYDDELRLLAVAKLAKPLQKLNNVDTTFVVRFDR